MGTIKITGGCGADGHPTTHFARIHTFMELDGVKTDKILKILEEETLKFKVGDPENIIRT